MTWRFIVDDRPRTGAENMAVDQALLEGVQAGGRPILRLYRWAPACLSFGRNQPARGLDVAAAASARGIDLVRRPTGGMAVYHDRELTYAVVAPVGRLGSPRESYRAINRALVAGLRRLGVAAEVAPERPGGKRRGGIEWASPCFDSAAPGEVVVAGRKLVGSAQRCEKRTLLQHGSVLLEGDQSEVVELLAGAVRAASSPTSGVAVPATASLEAVLEQVPAWEVLTAALRDGFEEALCVGLKPGGLDPVEAARAEVLVQRYRSDEWTWWR